MTLSEIRLALRLLRKQPVVTFTAVLALAVGIGMATAGFTLLDAVLFARLPFAGGDRFVLFDVYTEPDGRRDAIDTERFRHFAGNATTLEHVGAARPGTLNLLLPSDEIVSIKGAFVTPDSFRVLPYAPVLGRTLRADDGARGAAPVALIRESLWRRHFSADPAAVGSLVTIGGERRSIVGVMPDDFEFPGAGEIWLPIVESPVGSAMNPLAGARVFGVLQSGTRADAANAQIATLSKQFEAGNPAALRLRVVVSPFVEALSRGLDLFSGILVAALVLVLLVIAANVANLVLARTMSRSTELAIRAAIGATRGRLIGQVFVEVLIVGIVAAAIGLAASQSALAWITRTLTDMPSWVDFTASPRTMVFVVLATLLAAGVAGVLPALKVTRGDVAGTLASANRGSPVGFGALGSVMVALQVALSIAFLNSALVMARGVAGYMSPRLPAAANTILTARVTPTVEPDALVDAAKAMPGVSAAAAATSLPGLSPPARMTVIEPRTGEQADSPRAAPVVAIRTGFFDVLGGRASGGRLFAAPDFAPGAPPVAVVNEPFVRKFLGGANPIGRRLRIVESDPDAAGEPWREIVGVVPDLGLSVGDTEMAAGFYVPMGSEASYHLAIRTNGDALLLTNPLRTTLARLDPAIQFGDIRPIEDVAREDRAVFAGIGGALTALGGMALLLSIVGTYAMLSLSVTRRTREIGIRTALGATRTQVLQTLFGRTSIPLAIGAIGGIALGNAFVAARGIFAFRLPESSGPWGLPALGALMIAAGLVAAWVPARRALAVAPADALRAE